ncbi:MAG: hypothetical protein KF861_10155 [Planctomycetaceae bacterium]|nr:hypothetical protein [Planctomycetaceae bacterium]
MFVKRNGRRHNALRTSCLTSALLLVTSSCAMTPQFAQVTAESIPDVRASSPSDVFQSDAAPLPAYRNEPANGSAPPTWNDSASSIARPSSSAIQPVNFIPAAPRVALCEDPRGWANCPSACPNPYGFQVPGPPLPVYEPELYPEEYICDGGDRGVRVHYTDLGRQGLDTEDTVARFSDDAGCVHIKPSTRTCIYAPQFAAVRSTSTHLVNLDVERLAGTHDHRPSSGLRSRLSPGVELHNDQPVGFQSRSRVSGLDRDESNSAIARVQSPARHLKLNNAHENKQLRPTGQLDRTQEAYLAHAAQLAASWTRNLNPVIIATDAAGQEVISKFSIEEYVGVEDRSRKGDLRIVKLVDEPAAVPGDIVTFTIQYENVGDRGLYNIQIIDNLTPRLELLPETAQSDREGQFHVEDNLEGSSVLTFELAEPLPGHTSGKLTFQCRVR